MSGFRCCLSSVMDDCAAWDGVARGPRALRSHYNADFDAAGHDFVSGEFERRVKDIDHISRRRQRTSTVVPDGQDAAGAHSPRFEVRSLSIDDRARGRRRAHSEPPADVMPRESRVEQQLSMRAFGVIPCIDAGIHHRRRSCTDPDTPRSPTRDQAAKMAAFLGDLEGLTKRKHFHGSASPGSLLSPRLRAKSVESIDIDAHSGRSRPLPRRASTGMAPVSEESPNYDGAVAKDSSKFPGSPRGWSSNAFFEQNLEAKRYAKLLGRAANSNQKCLAELTDKEVVRELKKLGKQDACMRKMWADMSCDSSQRSLSKVLSALESPAESYQSLSTVASSEDAALLSSQLGEASKFAFAAVLEQELSRQVQRDHKASWRSTSASDGQHLEAGAKLPIHLRRVLASIDTNDTNLSEDNLIRCEKLLAGTDSQPTITQNMSKQPIDPEKVNSSSKQRFPLRRKSSKII